MFTSLKFNLAIVATIGLIVTATITAPFSSMFGKHYKESKDYACCEKDQLVINHYYTLNVFWVEVSEGYTKEKTGKEALGGCNIRCNE